MTETKVYEMMAVEDRADFVVLAVVMSLVDALKGRMKLRSRRYTRFEAAEASLLQVVEGYKGRLPENLADAADTILNGIAAYTNQLVVASAELTEHSAPALIIPQEA